MTVKQAAIFPKHGNPFELLINPSEEQLHQEADLPGGYYPFRWVVIKKYETLRRWNALEEVLNERVSIMTEDELAEKVGLCRKHFDELMLPPSFEGGPYAAQRYLNLFEMLGRILDTDKDRNLLPDYDTRIGFYMSYPRNKDIMDENSVIRFALHLITKHLGEKHAFKEWHDDCFTNVTQQQLDIIVETLARSGLSIYSKTFHERWVGL